MTVPSGNAEHHRREPDGERNASGLLQPGQHVAAKLIGAQQMRAREWRLEAMHDVDVQIVVRIDVRSERGRQHQEQDRARADQRQTMPCEAPQRLGQRDAVRRIGSAACQSRRMRGS